MENKKTDDDNRPIIKSDPQAIPNKTTIENSPDAKKQRNDSHSYSSRSPGNLNEHDPNSFLTRPSPPQFVAMEEILKAADGVNNMILAHEIAVNSEFEIKKQELADNSLSKKVAEIMKQAFWDSLDDKLKQEEPDYTQVLILIEEIRQMTESLLLPQHAVLKTQLNEFLDLELIKQQIENECFDVGKTVNSVVVFLSKLCAPIRDQEIEKLRKTEGIVDILKGIFHLLENMKLDMTNFTIQQMRPIIQQQSAEYERTKFSEFLRVQAEHGLDGLELTRKWLKASYVKMKDLDENKDHQIMPQELLTEAYLDLLDMNSSYDEYPDTLVMDATRLSELSDKTRRFVLISTIILVVYNTVGASVSGLTELRNLLKSHLIAIMSDIKYENLKNEVTENVCQQVCKDVNEILLKHGFQSLSTEKSELLAFNVKAVFNDEEHHVLNLLQRRLRLFFRHLLNPSIIQNKIQIPQGLTLFTENISSAASQLVRLCKHNRVTFGAYYAEIIKSILGLSGESGLTPKASPRDPEGAAATV